MGLAVESYPVAKGPVLRCLDALSVRDDARSRLDKLQTEIIGLRGQEFQGLEGVFDRFLFTVTGLYPRDQIDKITAHLKTHWFSQETGWWPWFQPIAPIYALGLLRTLYASLASTDPRPFPIDSYWIIGHDQVEMVNLVSSRQVTLLVATPPPVEFTPGGIQGIQGADSEAWATARRAGQPEGEVDPITQRPLSTGGTELRVRTFPVPTRTPRRS